MQGKKIIIAADHAGCPLKQHLINYLKSQEYDLLHLGTTDESLPVDYPDKAYLLAKSLYNHEGDIGILVCGSGIGMSIAVNRYQFIRGALVCSPEMADLARRHNNANVLIFGGRLISPDIAQACTDVFLKTPFEGGRHEARVQKLERMDHDFEDK